LEPADAARDHLPGWIGQIRAIRKARDSELAALPNDETRWKKLCEFNVLEQVRVLNTLPIVLRARERGQPLAVHGWIYDLHDGLLRDLQGVRGEDEGNKKKGNQNE
jgi:carbonic anhydrase